MKLVLSVQELQQAVAEFIEKHRNAKVDPKQVTIRTVAEGQYDDQTLELDGAEVPLPEEKTDGKDKK